MRLTPIAVIAAALLLSACDNSPSQTTSTTQETKPSLTPEQRSQMVATVTKGFDVERDKVEKISFYTPKITSSEWAKQSLGVYISLPDARGPIFRIYPHYTGSDWIFFEKIKVMADDAIIYEKEFSFNDMKRDNGAGGVYESVDYAAKTDDIEAMRKIPAAKSVTVRLSGKDHREDFDMSKADQQRIALALKAYDELKPLSN